jgi:hypothetical protein
MIVIKKQLAFLICLSSILTISAQNKTIYYGSPVTGGAQIHLSKKNTYKIFVEHGSYAKYQDKKGEFIVFKSPELEQEGFKVIESPGRKKLDSITVHYIRERVVLDEEDIYIGYKIKESNTFNYLNLIFETRLFNTNPEEEGFSFKIPRTDEIEIVYKQDKFYVDKFKLSPNAANVYFGYRHLSRKPYNSLVFAQIETTGKLIVNRGFFSVNNPPAKYVKRTASDSVQSWNMPFEVEKAACKKFNNPKFVYKPVATVSPGGYDVEYPKIESLEKAITILKQNDSKILLIFNTLLDNNAKYYFEDIAAEVHKNSSLDYLSDYYFDRYVLYLAKPEDIKTLKKYKSENVNEVIALNSDLDVIYKENISAKDYSYKYRSLDKKLSRNILAVDALNKFKKKCDNGTLTAKDFLELGKYWDNQFVKKAIKKKQHDDDLFEITENNTNDNKKDNTAINFYWPAINSAEILKGLSLLIEKHKNDETIDIDFAKLAFHFISYPFFGDITGKSKYPETAKEYYDFCLYLSRFQIETKLIQYGYTQYNNNHFIEIENILKQEGTKRDFPEIVKATFKNLLLKKEQRLHIIFHYYDYLLMLGEQPFDDFDIFFKEIMPQPKNYSGQLKKYYDIHSENAPYIDDFEYYITAMCNSMSWQVVSKHNNNKKLVKKALEWSKSSVELSPGNHFYTDTYAHLEYFMGNKQKAIELETKSIMLAEKEKHKNLAEYKKTLEKMKKGTLNYSFTISN